MKGFDSSLHLTVLSVTIFCSYMYIVNSDYSPKLTEIECPYIFWASVYWTFEICAKVTRPTLLH